MALLWVTPLPALAGAAADAPIWQTGRTASGAPFAAVVGDDGKTPALRFECGERDVVATVYGATKLRDPATGRAIGDKPGSTISANAAQLALVTDGEIPRYVWAEAKPNRVAGWDLTIRVSKDHGAFTAFPQAEMIGLFTTGGGTLAGVQPADRVRLAEFVKQCRGR
jgi:hypothetical protein